MENFPKPKRSLTMLDAILMSYLSIAGMFFLGAFVFTCQDVVYEKDTPREKLWWRAGMLFCSIACAAVWPLTLIAIAVAWACSKSAE
jgi:hypothetical protein